MIHLNNITKSFASGVYALKDINLHIKRGEIFGIIGKSGAGKSTLLRCINALEVPTQGSIIFDTINILQQSKKELQETRHQIGFIFQHFNLLSSRNVFENIALPLEFLKLDSETIESKVSAMIGLTGLSDKVNDYPEQLSGGQKQRVAIARALVTDPKVILCDEATSALDPVTSTTILNLLKKINLTMGITIVLITHDFSVVKLICDRVAVLNQGELVELGEVTHVFNNPSTEVTKELIQHATKQEITGHV